MSKEVELKDVKENEQDEKETDLDADESTPMVSYGELVRYNPNMLKFLVKSQFSIACIVLPTLCHKQKNC